MFIFKSVYEVTAFMGTRSVLFDFFFDFTEMLDW